MLRRTALATAAALLASSGLAATAPPAAAAPATLTSVTLVGSFLPTPWAYQFTEANATLNVATTAGSVTVTVHAPGGDSYRVALAAPAGQPLAVGTYEHAHRLPTPTPALPSVEVSGEGKACSTGTGRFRVLDVGFDGDGDVDRLWATYEHHCASAYPAVFGEVRVNSAPPADGITLRNAALDFPETYPGLTRDASVWLVNGSAAPVTVEGFVFGGTGKEAFRVAATDCSTVAPGAACRAIVEFRPADPGRAYDATLTFDDDSAAGGRTAALSGRTVAGRTSFTADSEDGDYVGGGGTYSYVPSGSVVFGAQMFLADGRHLEFGTDGPGDDWWDVGFSLPAGQTFVNGTTYVDDGDPTTNGPQLRVGAFGRGCSTPSGSSTITDLSYVPDGIEVLRFVATFDQRCVGSSAHLRGAIEWRAPGPTPPDVVGPDPVGALEAAPRLRAATLSWAPPAAPDVARYVVRRKTGVDNPPSAHTSGTGVYSGTATSAKATDLVDGTSYTFAVYALDAAGNPSPPAVVSLHGTTVGLSTTATTLTYGSPVGLGVTLRSGTAPLAGQPVDVLLQSATDPAFRKVATVTTGQDGTARLTSYPRTSGTYAALFAGRLQYLGSTAAEPLVVRTRVSAGLRGSTLSGSVAPGYAGTWVYLQRWVPGAGWRNVTSATLSPESRYAFSLTRRGTYRVVKPATALHARGTSASRTL